MKCLAIAAALAAGLAAAASSGAKAADPIVVELTQVGCQFLESENGEDRGFMPKSADDCVEINERTGAGRLDSATVLELAPGKYIFRVTNLNVPYDLGFWLRSHDYSSYNPLHKLTKISVSGGGLKTGTTKDYVVELEPGEYIYSCPLNPTPDYRLIVKG